MNIYWFSLFTRKALFRHFCVAPNKRNIHKEYMVYVFKICIWNDMVMMTITTHSRMNKIKFICFFYICLRTRVQCKIDIEIIFFYFAQTHSHTLRIWKHSLLRLWKALLRFLQMLAHVRVLYIEFIALFFFPCQKRSKRNIQLSTHFHARRKKN